MRDAGFNDASVIKVVLLSSEVGDTGDGDDLRSHVTCNSSRGGVESMEEELIERDFKGFSALKTSRLALHVTKLSTCAAAFSTIYL